MLQMMVALEIMGNNLRDRMRREDGATAVEYGIMVALIAVVIIATVETIGTKLNTAFTNVSGKLK